MTDEPLFDRNEVEAFANAPILMRPGHTVLIDDLYIDKLESVVNRMTAGPDDAPRFEALDVETVKALVGELDDILIYFSRAKVQQYPPDDLQKEPS